MPSESVVNPEWTAFTLGLLFGAVKIAAIGTVGFGIAWWRARARIKQLEAERLQALAGEERIARVEQNVELVVDQLDRLVRAHADLTSRLSPGVDTGRALPSAPPEDGISRP